MITDFKQDQLDKYINNKMNIDEMSSFEQLLNSDTELLNEFEIQLAIKEAITKLELKNKFKIWETPKTKKNHFAISTNYKKYFGIAASILLIIGGSLFIINKDRIFSEKTESIVVAEANEESLITEQTPASMEIPVDNNSIELSLDKINESIHKKYYHLEVKKEQMGFGERPKEILNIEVITLEDKLKLLNDQLLTEMEGSKLGYGPSVKSLKKEIEQTNKLLNTYEFNENKLIIYSSSNFMNIEILKSIEGYYLTIDNIKYKITKNRKGKLIKTN